MPASPPLWSYPDFGLSGSAGEVTPGAVDVTLAVVSLQPVLLGGLGGRRGRAGWGRGPPGIPCCLVRGLGEGTAVSLGWGEPTPWPSRRPSRTPTGSSRGRECLL